MDNHASWRAYTRFFLYAWPILWIIANGFAIYAGTITPFTFPQESAASSEAVSQYLDSFSVANPYYILFSVISIPADTALFCLSISFRQLFGSHNFKSQLASLLIMLGGLCGILTDISWTLVRVFSQKYLSFMSPEVSAGFWNIMVWTYHLGLWISCYGFIMAGGFGILLVGQLAKNHPGFSRSWIYLTYFVSLASFLFAIITIIGTFSVETNLSSAFALITIILIPVWAIWLAQQIKHIQPVN